LDTSTALANRIKATPEPIPPIVTNFLTEDDLNKALMKFIYWAASIALPGIVLKVIEIFQQRKNNVDDIRKDIHEIKILLAGQPERIREIAREEIEYTIKHKPRGRES
jgi:hypothetical protein